MVWFFVFFNFHQMLTFIIISLFSRINYIAASVVENLTSIIFIMKGTNLTKKNLFIVKTLNNFELFTSNSWVGSISVSMCSSLLLSMICELRFRLRVLFWWEKACFFRWSDLEKLLPQISHLCFLSPVCILKCRWSSSDLVNFLEHPGQEHRYGWSPICHRRWARRWEVFCKRLKY